MQRPALATGETAVENVPHDAARESETVAAGLALLLDDPLGQQPVHRFVQVPGAFGERLQVAELEAPPQDRGRREKVAKLRRETFDSLLDRLLNRGRERVG